MNHYPALSSLKKSKNPGGQRDKQTENTSYFKLFLYYSYFYIIAI